MKTIIHLASVHNRTDNRVFYKQCVDLAANGFMVKLIVADGKGDDLVDDVEVLDFNKFSSNNRLLRLFITSPIVTIKALRLRADLYHIHDPELLFYYFLFSPFFSSKKIVFDMHENLSEQVKSKPWIPSFLRPLLAASIKIYENIVFRHVAVIFAEKSYLKSFPNLKRYETVLNFPKPSWVEEKHNKSDVKEVNKEPVIGYVGRVGVDRGADILLGSVVAINKSGRSLRVVLLGNVPQEVYDKSDFNYLKAKGLLDAPGFVDNNRAVEIVQSWDIGFCVLRDLPNFIESYPTKLFEYMAAGVPVITSDFPLYRELIDETGGGICIQPNSEAELTDAILRILDAPNKYYPQIDMTKYGWPGQLSKLAQFYSTIL